MIFYKDRFGVWSNKDTFMRIASRFQPTFPKDVSDLAKYLKETGCITEEKTIENPTVVDYLKFGMHYEAVIAYYHIHNSTLMDARKMVEKIEEDIKKYTNS